jgi:hypothetical protein
MRRIAPHQVFRGCTGALRGPRPGRARGVARGALDHTAASSGGQAIPPGNAEVARGQRRKIRQGNFGEEGTGRCFPIGNLPRSL